MRSVEWSRFAMALALLAPIAACSSSPSEPLMNPDPEAATVVAEVGSTFDLRPGQTARIGSSGLVVGFRGVAGDSRCPVDVTCVWAGDATLRIRLAMRGGDWSPFDLHTNLEPRTAAYTGFTVSVVGLSPDPRSDQKISSDRYTVTLRVE
jgi:hypothetical protein